MKTLVIKPDGWPVPLGKVRPGLFVFEENIGLKTEYNEYLTAGGDIFWAGAKTAEERSRLLVQPVKYQWIVME